MRRFALSTLRDFGMGKKAAEEKIIEETQYLIKLFEKHEGNSTPVLYYCLACLYMEFYVVLLLIYIYFYIFFFLGKPFSSTQSINNAVSNIICSIVYGSRFDYSDPEFTRMVDRANENVRLSGSRSIQVPLCQNIYHTMFGTMLAC